MMEGVAVDRITAPLIGRGAELVELLGATGIGDAPADDAAGGQTPGGGGSVLLGGDAGVGKTRLLAELRSAAAAAGMRVMVGHCIDLGDAAPPYLPFSEMFSRLATEDPGTARQLAQQHHATSRLAFRIADSATAPIGRGDLLDDVHSALSELGAGGPVLVVVEDAHWADRSTQDMLSLLLTRGFDVPVSIVVSYRTDDLHRRHPLRPALAQWSRLGQVHRMLLPPLSDADVSGLVRSLHAEPLAESTVHGIVSRAEGNAFFAEELVGATEAGVGRVPDDLAGLLLIRLDSLDDTTRSVVRAASVSGRRVPHALLSAVVGLPADALDTAVRTAVERNILVPATNGYSFRHALLAEAVYDDLLPGERTRLHAAYVRALSTAGQDADAADVARHARAARDLETAVRAGIRAGAEAMEVGGPDEAAQQYEHVFEVVQRTPDLAPDIDRIDLLAAWVDALMAAGQSVRAISVARQQVEQMGEGSEPVDQARALAVMAGAALIEDSWLALETAREGLLLVPPEPRSDSTAMLSSRTRARLLSVSARASLGYRRLDDVLEAGAEAIDLGERLGMTTVVADVTTTLARLKEYTGDPKSSATSLENVIDAAVARGDTSAELRARHHLGGVHLGEGDLALAFAAYRTGAERAAQLGRPWAPYGIDSRVLAAICAHMSGDWQSAEELVDVAGSNPPAIAEAGLGAAELLLAAGRGRSDAVAGLDRIRQFWTFDGLIAVTSAFAAIDLYGDAGDLDGAIAVHDEAVALLTQMWEHHGYPARVRLSALLLAHLAVRAAVAGQSERQSLFERGQVLLADARQAYARSADQPQQVGPEARAWAARADAEFARLSWIAGIEPVDAGELAARWETSVEEFVRLGNRFEEARSRTRWAAVLRSGEPKRASQQADIAAAIATELRAVPLLDELRSVVGSAGRSAGPAARSVTHRAGLTQREAEILALVAEGRSNGEIGKRLFISTKTVSVHVSNVLAKLGASGRTEAAAIGRDRGLI
jgi:DNA-binding CsgD family transcriptional regulator